MVRWFWFFMIYSFAGFILEVVFARITHNPKRDRKCLCVLPLCPVYGLGALAILALPPAVLVRPWLLVPCAALTATAVEYFTGLFYERATCVSFWDYSHLPLNVGGKVCLLFTAFWGLLGLGLVYGVHPAAAALADWLPASWAIPVAIFLALDTAVTITLLRRTRSTEVLRWYLRGNRRAHQHG